MTDSKTRPGRPRNGKQKTVSRGRYSRMLNQNMSAILRDEAADADALLPELLNLSIAAEGVRSRLHLLAASITEAMQSPASLLDAVTTISRDPTGEVREYRQRLETTAATIRKNHPEEGNDDGE